MVGMMNVLVLDFFSVGHSPRLGKGGCRCFQSFESRQLQEGEVDSRRRGFIHEGHGHELHLGHGKRLWRALVEIQRRHQRLQVGEDFRGGAVNGPSSCLFCLRR